MLVQHSKILPNLTTLLQNPQGQKHPLQEGNQIQLLAWKVSGKPWKVREYQNSLLQLSQIPEGQGQYLITNRAGESGIADFMSERLIPLQLIKKNFFNFLAFFMKKVMSIALSILTSQRYRLIMYIKKTILLGSILGCDRYRQVNDRYL